MINIQQRGAHVPFCAQEIPESPFIFPPSHSGKQIQTLFSVTADIETLTPLKGSAFKAASDMQLSPHRHSGQPGGCVTDLHTGYVPT